MDSNAALHLRVQRFSPLPFQRLSGNSGELFHVPGIHFPSQPGFIVDLLAEVAVQCHPHCAVLRASLWHWVNVAQGVIPTPPAPSKALAFRMFPYS